MMYMWLAYGKPDISMAANGLLAGLVAITAPCAFVNSVSAVVIGGVAGILLCWGVFFVERTLKIDDPVGAISVHGINGTWGVLSLGLFADGTYGDGPTAWPGRSPACSTATAGSSWPRSWASYRLVFVFTIMLAFSRS
jgi:Amt family ammonium transporter